MSNSLYRGINQKLPSALLWDPAVVNAINFACNDIYARQGKSRTFMYSHEEIDWVPWAITWTTPTSKTFTYPIVRIAYIEDKDLQTLNVNYPIQYYSDKTKVTDKFRLLNIDTDYMQKREFFFQSYQKDFKIYPNSSGYRVHYVHGFNRLTKEDAIPLPDCFLWALYNLTLSYLFPQDWQYWDGKENSAYAKAKDQLNSLASMDWQQLNSIIWNVN